jgi:hypothetical protein
MTRTVELSIRKKPRENTGFLYLCDELTTRYTCVFEDASTCILRADMVSECRDKTTAINCQCCDVGFVMATYGRTDALLHTDQTAAENPEG